MSMRPEYEHAHQANMHHIFCAASTILARSDSANFGIAVYNPHTRSGKDFHDNYPWSAKEREAALAAMQQEASDYLVAVTPLDYVSSGFVGESKQRFLATQTSETIPLVILDDGASFTFGVPVSLVPQAIAYTIPPFPLDLDQTTLNMLFVHVYQRVRDELLNKGTLADVVLLVGDVRCPEGAALWRLAGMRLLSGTTLLYGIGPSDSVAFFTEKHVPRDYYTKKVGKEQLSPTTLIVLTVHTHGETRMQTLTMKAITH